MAVLEKTGGQCRAIKLGDHRAATLNVMGNGDWHLKDKSA